MKSAERKKKFEVGRAYFNAKKFFEAHEFWEEIWLLEPEPDKTFLQGLIQIAAAFHHYQRKNPEGAESLLASGIVKLTRFPDNHHGLAIGELRAIAKRWARAFGAGEELGEIHLPTIALATATRNQSSTATTKKMKPSARTKAPQ
jgi:uncharacterized protein